MIIQDPSGYWTVDKDDFYGGAIFTLIGANTDKIKISADNKVVKKWEKEEKWDKGKEKERKGKGCLLIFCFEQACPPFENSRFSGMGRVSPLFSHLF